MTRGLLRPLHLLPPGIKLMGLLAFGIATMVIPGWIPAIVALSIAAALALLSGLGMPRTLRIVLGFALVGAPLFVFQLWRDGVFTAIEIVADLLALILAASAVTASTTASELLETLSRAARPLRHFGVSPERVALACSLAIRSIPLARTVAQETLEAARARGLERSPRAFAAPYAVRMIAHAQDTGAALHARGLGDD